MTESIESAGWIDALRDEFAGIMAQTDYVLDKNLVRAAVRQYLKARIRVLQRDSDPDRYQEHLLTRKREQRRYRAGGGPGSIRGYDVVLKPARRRKRKAIRTETVVWSGRDSLTVYPTRVSEDLY